MAKGLGSRNIVELQNLPTGRLLMQLAWPVILSQLVQGAYNIVDSIYLARLGEEALSAVSLSFVVQNLTAAFFTGIATGMNAVISRAIGAGNSRDTRNAVISGASVQLFFVICFMMFGFLGVPRYFALSSTNQAVISAGISYLRPILIFGVFACTQITAERLLQASGQTGYMLVSQIIGTIVNCILDPILIFGLVGCPRLGVAGAAYATLVGQFCAAAVALFFNLKKNSLVFGENGNRVLFSWKLAGRICKIGIPTASMGIAACIGNYYINRILIGFFDTANAAFGVYTKIQSVGLMPTQGFGAALVTMIAFYLGKRDPVRIRKSLRSGLIMIGTWNTIMTIALMVFPRVLLAPFNPTPQMIEVGVPCCRIIGLTWLVSGYMLALNSFLQATGWSIFTLLVSISRQVLVRTPVAVWLSGFGKMSLIWWSWPISEVTSDIVCLVFFVITYRKVMGQLALDTMGRENEKQKD